MANFVIYVAATPPATPQGEAIRAKLGAGIAASKGREFNTLGTVLGVGYAGSPVIANEPQHMFPAPAPDDGRRLPIAFELAKVIEAAALPKRPQGRPRRSSEQLPA